MQNQQAVQRIFTAWMVLSALLLAIITAQTVLGKYGDDYPAAWSWAISLIVPSLAVLGGAVFVEPKPAWKKAQPDPFRYRCAMWGSVLLGLAAFLVLACEPLVPMSPFELFSVSGVALALFQGIVLAAISAVIFDKR